MLGRPRRENAYYTTSILFFSAQPASPRPLRLLHFHRGSRLLRSFLRGAKQHRVEARLAQSDGAEHAYQRHASLLAPLHARPVAPVDGVAKQRGQGEDAPPKVIIREAKDLSAERSGKAATSTVQLPQALPLAGQNSYAVAYRSGAPPKSYAVPYRSGAPQNPMPLCRSSPLQILHL